MGQCKLALIQMDCELLAKEKNVAKATKLVEEACREGAEFICLPEAFNTGYYSGNIAGVVALAEPIDGPTVTGFQEMALSKQVHLVVPFIHEVAPGCCQNAAALINNRGEVLGTYAKTHPVGDEPNHFKRGEDYPVWETKFGKVGMLICYDACFPEAARLLALKGAELVIVPSAWRASYYFVHWWNLNLACRALDSLYFVAAVNRCGPSGSEKFAGCSQVVNPLGEVLATCSVDEERILYQTIDFDQVEKERAFNTVLRDRHPQDYGILSSMDTLQTF